MGEKIGVDFKTIGALSLINVMATGKGCTAEFFQNIGLTNLPGAPENQRFAVRR
jgi:hypothetical protein